MSATPIETDDWKRSPDGIAGHHWIDLISEVGEDGEHWWKAYVKWDGCGQIDRAFNVPFGAPDRDADHMASQDGLHFCDLDDLIARLTKLRDAAKKHFGEDWPR
jgi:hypothetical protein